MGVSAVSAGGTEVFYCPVAGVMAESFGLLRCRALAGAETIVPRMGELGAKKPWYRNVDTRGWQQGSESSNKVLAAEQDVSGAVAGKS